MRTNSFGWVFLFVVLIATFGYFGSYLLPNVNGYTFNGDFWGFLRSMFGFRLSGYGQLFGVLSWFMILMGGWIVYRQIRGIGD